MGSATVEAPAGTSVERRFAAMGTRVHIIVVGPEAMVEQLAATAVDRIDQLEARWSRFRPTSEVSHLNAAEGEALPVSPDTIELIVRALTAWQLTDGAFDPTVLHAMEAHGYDRSFNQIGQAQLHPTDASPGCEGIVIDRSQGTVRLPVGVGIDPGGIGKGLAADIVVAETLAAGATGVLISLGGDTVARGASPTGHGWTITIDEDTVAAHPIATLAFDGGAVATSVVTRRTWNVDGQPRHHLLDPTTGQPTNTTAALVTVLAAEGWLAEAATKAYICGHISPAVASIPALVRHTDGTTTAHSGMEEFLT